MLPRQGAGCDFVICKGWRFRTILVAGGLANEVNAVISAGGQVLKYCEKETLQRRRKSAAECKVETEGGERRDRDRTEVRDPGRRTQGEGKG